MNIIEDGFTPMLEASLGKGGKGSSKGGSKGSRSNIRGRRHARRLSSDDSSKGKGPICGKSKGDSSGIECKDDVAFLNLVRSVTLKVISLCP
jgi:hypothetical protein